MSGSPLDWITTPRAAIISAIIIAGAVASVRDPPEKCLSAAQVGEAIRDIETSDVGLNVAPGYKPQITVSVRGPNCMGVTVIGR